MNYIKRILDINNLLQERSLFLFGARQTGKSSYIKEQIEKKPAKIFNLLDQGILQRIMQDPTWIRAQIEALNLRDELIVIDEIQKCPVLLDEVHLMIEDRGLRFLLTGSSARKLKRSGTNLLGGRARDRSFHPFVYPELKPHGFDLFRALNHGLLPFHYLSQDPTEDIHAYVGRYLTEEIAAEGIARNIPNFARFLQVAATANAQLINYSSLGSDSGLSRQTTQAYFQILYDTLLAFELLPYTNSVKRKAIQTAKFYFFDLAVVRVLRQIEETIDGTKDFGDAFEHFIFLEIKAYLSYFKPRTSLHFWRSKSGFEVDFILGGKIAIEVKASKRLGNEDFKGLKAFEEEGIADRLILICREKELRLINNVMVYPWEMFLDDLWGGKIIAS